MKTSHAYVFKLYNCVTLECWIHCMLLAVVHVLLMSYIYEMKQKKGPSHKYHFTFTFLFFFFLLLLLIRINKHNNSHWNLNERKKKEKHEQKKNITPNTCKMRGSHYYHSIEQTLYSVGFMCLCCEYQRLSPVACRQCE